VSISEVRTHPYFSSAGVFAKYSILKGYGTVSPNNEIPNLSSFSQVLFKMRTLRFLKTLIGLVLQPHILEEWNFTLLLTVTQYNHPT
jgi:hypothetical protein